MYICIATIRWLQEGLWCQREEHSRKHILTVPSEQQLYEAMAKLRIEYGRPEREPDDDDDEDEEGAARDRDDDRMRISFGPTMLIASSTPMDEARLQQTASWSQHIAERQRRQAEREARREARRLAELDEAAAEEASARETYERLKARFGGDAPEGAAEREEDR